jgi:hypothetical protein
MDIAEAMFKMQEQIYNLKAENERLKFELDMEKWKIKITKAEEE